MPQPSRTTRAPLLTSLLCLVSAPLGACRDTVEESSAEPQVTAVGTISWDPKSG